MGAKTQISLDNVQGENEIMHVRVLWKTLAGATHVRFPLVVVTILPSAGEKSELGQATGQINT